MLHHKPILPLLILGTVLCLASAGATAPEPMALLGVFNYSGTAKAGVVDLEDKMPELVAESLNSQSPDSVWSLEDTQERLEDAGLEDLGQVVNLCTDDDFARIGRRLGAGRVAFLEIQGYSEIKREGEKKTYQVLLGLVVIDCSDRSVFEPAGEGLGDTASKAMENAAHNLASRFFSLPSEANRGNVRDENMPVVGNVQSMQYHLPDCHHLPTAGDSVNFPNHGAAESGGFTPCPICFPPPASGSSYDRNLEDNLGRAACGEIEFYYRVRDDPAVIARLERVAAPLVASTTRYHVDYRFIYLDDPTVNSFSAPNGYIYVTRGLMEIIESDDELAMVIAHEMAHIERKHAVVRYKQALALAIIGSLFAAGNDSSSDDVMVSVAVNLIMKGFSREQEMEADETAVSHLKRAGMNWEAYRTLFGRFIDLRERRIFAVEAVFGTHPKPEDRIENLDHMLAAYQDFLGKLQ